MVEGIVSIDRYDVEIRGFCQSRRHDPYAGPSRRPAGRIYLTVAVNDEVRRAAGAQVGTVGQFAVSPNAPNVVPGRVMHDVELRDLSAKKIAALGAKFRTRAAEIAAQDRHRNQIRKLAAHHDAALATPEVQQSIEAAAPRSAPHRIGCPAAPATTRR